ncbi:dolichyl-diphosphooligosaccharide--protein glycosyltransferase subunit 2-like protein [Tanacetum coccineum]
MDRHLRMILLHEHNVIAFTYRRNGELVNYKFRSIIVEGEIDKLSMDQAGIPDCVSVPDGAPHQVAFPQALKYRKNGQQLWVYIKDHIDARVPITASRHSINTLNIPIETTWRPWFSSATSIVEFLSNVLFDSIIIAGHVKGVFFTQVTMSLSGAKMETYVEKDDEVISTATIRFLKFGVKCSYADAGVKGTSSSTIDVEADIKTNKKLIVLGGSGFLGSAICKAVAANHFMIICQVVQKPKEQLADADALLNITNTLVTSVKAQSNEGLTTGDCGISCFCQGLGIMNSEVKQRKVIVHRKHSRLTEKARTEEMPIMDKVKELGTVLMGKVESGSVHEDDNLLVMPNKVRVLATYCDEVRVRSARPGENLRVRVSGIEVEDIRSRFVLSSIDMFSFYGWMDALPEGVDIGDYVFAFEIVLSDPGLKSKYASGDRTNVSVHVTRVVKVDNVKVTLLEGDSVESEKKLNLPGKNDVALSANHHQKLNLSFLLTTPFGKNLNLVSVNGMDLGY